MFTDVKNLAPNQGLDISSLATNYKPKGKFHKLFKPLLRLLRSAKKNSSSCTQSIAHPNNVNLNNNLNLVFIAPPIMEALGENITKANYEDYAVVIRKVAREEEFLRSYFAEDPFSEATPYALDCSVTKSQPTTACSCSHGLNCQQYHEPIESHDDCCKISPTKDISVDSSFIPVHFVRTENGSFFWTAEQVKLDDDLIEPLHYTSHLEPAQAQWDNRAILY